MEIEEYFFVCKECGQVSELLCQYIILKKDRRWICLDCVVDTHKKVEKFLNGYIIELEVF